MKSSRRSPSAFNLRRPLPTRSPPTQLSPVSASSPPTKPQSPYFSTSTDYFSTARSSVPSLYYASQTSSLHMPRINSERRLSARAASTLPKPTSARSCCAEKRRKHKRDKNRQTSLTPRSFPAGPHLQSISAEYEALLQSSIGQHLKKLREYLESRYLAILEAGQRALQRSGKDAVLRALSKDRGENARNIVKQRLGQLFIEETIVEREAQLDQLSLELTQLSGEVSRLKDELAQERKIRMREEANVQHARETLVHYSQDRQVMQREQERKHQKIRDLINEYELSSRPTRGAVLIASLRQLHMTTKLSYQIKPLHRMEDPSLLRVELDHTRSKIRELVDQNTELVSLLQQLRVKLADKKAQYLQKVAESEALNQKLQEVSIDKAVSGGGVHEITFDGSEKDASVMRLHKVESVLQGDVESARQQLLVLQQCLLDEVQQREKAVRGRQEIEQEFEELKHKLQLIHKEAQQTAKQLQDKRREVKVLKSQLKQIEDSLHSKLTEKQDEIQNLLTQLHEATSKEEEGIKLQAEREKKLSHIKTQLQEKTQELEEAQNKTNEIQREKEAQTKRFERESEDKQLGMKEMEAELRELRTGVTLLKNECVRSQTAQRILKSMQERVKQAGTTAVSCCRAVHQNLRGYKAEMDDMRAEIEKALTRYSEKERLRETKLHEKSKEHTQQLKDISSTFTQQHAQQMASHSKELKEFQTLLEQVQEENRILRLKSEDKEQLSQFEAMKAEILKYKQDKETQIQQMEEQIAQLAEQHGQETEGLRRELESMQEQLGEKDAHLAQLQEHAQTSNALLAEQELRLAFLDGVATGSKNSPHKKEMPTPRASSFFSEREENLSDYESQVVVRDKREVEPKDRKGKEEEKKEKKKEKQLKDEIEVKDAVIRKLQNELSNKTESYSVLNHKNRVLSGEVARLSMSTLQSPVRESIHSTQLEALRKKKKEIEARMATHTPKFKTGPDGRLLQSPTHSVQFESSSFLSPRAGSLYELGEQIRQQRLLRESMGGTRGGLSPSHSKLTVSQLSRA